MQGWKSGETLHSRWDIAGWENADNTKQSTNTVHTETVFSAADDLFLKRPPRHLRF